MRRVFALALLPAIAVLSTASAAEAPDESRACQACHGVDGISISTDIPNLAGQKKDYLLAQLRAFKSGARKNDYMAAITAQLDEPKMTALAEFWNKLPATGAGDVAHTVPAARSSPMQFPKDFPAHFTEYQRDDSPQDKMVNVYYANDVAFAAARAHKPLPDGSILIVGFFSVKLDAAGKPLLDKNGKLVSDKAQSYSGMQTQAGWGKEIPELLRNGDWRYGLFGADGTRKDSPNYAVCLACHKPVAAQSYVFTSHSLEEKAKAK